MIAAFLAGCALIGAALGVAVEWIRIVLERRGQ